MSNETKETSPAALVGQAIQSLSRKVVVFGASGRLGRETVATALDKGLRVVAVTRTGELAEPITNIALTVVKGDLRETIGDSDEEVSSSTLAGLVDGAHAIFFAASSSKLGGSPAEVDTAA
jgi:uncharacterized protein YbjT (DUF2867 family)